MFCSENSLFVMQKQCFEDITHLLNHRLSIYVYIMYILHKVSTVMVGNNTIHLIYLI